MLRTRGQNQSLTGKTIVHLDIVIRRGIIMLHYVCAILYYTSTWCCWMARNHHTHTHNPPVPFLCKLTTLDTDNSINFSPFSSAFDDMTLGSGSVFRHNETQFLGLFAVQFLWLKPGVLWHLLAVSLSPPLPHFSHLLTSAASNIHLSFTIIHQFDLQQSNCHWLKACEWWWMAVYPGGRTNPAAQWERWSVSVRNGCKSVLCVWLRMKGNLQKHT